MFIAYLSLLGLTVLWGVTFPVIQTALHDASPMVFVAVRFAIAALFFALFVWPRAFRWSREQLWKGLVLGFSLWGGYAFQTAGLGQTTSARSGFLTGVFVPLTPLFSWLLFREKISFRMWMAALLAFTGIVVMSNPDVGGLSWGDILTLICAVSFALQIVYVGRWANKQNEYSLVWLQLLVVSLFSVFCFPLEVPRFELTTYLTVTLIITAVFGSAFGIWAQIRFQPRISATAAAIIFACEPLFAGLAAWLIQHETLPAATLIGAAFIISGMVLSSIPSKTKRVLP